MIPEFYREDVIEGLHGIVRTLVIAARRDKKLIKKDTKPLIGDYAGLIVHVKVNRFDSRRIILMTKVKAETIVSRLRGEDVKLAVPIDARIIAMDMLMTDKETSLSLPERIPMFRIQTG